MEILIIFLNVLILAFVLIKIFRHPFWAIRIFDFPQVQILFLALVAMLLNILFFSFDQWYHWLLMAVLLAGIAYELKIVLPYTILHRKQAEDAINPSPAVSILVSNVYMKNREYSRLMSLVHRKDPDILITLETDQRWQDALQPLRDSYPWGVNVPLDNMYGLHFYSKLPLENLEVRYLIENDVPSVRANISMPDGRRIRIYAIHPKPPSPTENDESLERDGELYLVAREVRESELPVIVAGDLNDVAWSHSTRMFQRISRLLDPRIGRGFFNTFHSKIPILRWPLDHIFHSSHFAIADIERLDSIGSDHFPMYISLVLTTSDDNGHAPENADHQDHNEAGKVIIQARNKN